MSKEDFPSRKEARPSTPPRGLLERADDLFHFEDAIKGDALPPLAIPPELIPPEPQPKPAPVASVPAEAGVAAAPVPGTATGVPLAGVPGVAAGVAEAEPAPRARDWTGPRQPLDRTAMAEAGYLVPGGPVTRLAEEFRIVKREVLDRVRGGRHQPRVPNGNVILMASAHSGEGKTYCAVNLAVSLAAEAGLEVLLVDADFAQPKILPALGLSAEKGLMDALADPTLSVEDMVIRTDVPSLSVLGAGSGNDRDAEFLSSGRLDGVLAALVSGRPDRVLLFDSSPLLAASSAAVLAAHVGQVLLVVRADITTESALRDAAGLLKGCDTVELLLNGVSFSASGRQYGSYYGKDD